LFRIDYNGTDIVRGEVVEVVANERVVVTWGWEAAGAVTRPDQASLNSRWCRMATRRLFG
jgi:uncharacterized protein YndB with AHSA1/START domain